MNEISFTKVKLPYGWLGNMSPYPIRYNDLVYRTGEALFQVLRFEIDDPICETIRRATSPMAAKMIAKQNSDLMVVTPRSDEDVENMRLVLRLKLEQNPELSPMLLATGDAVLIEDCSARPNESGLFWGMARSSASESWRGQNWLGKLWIELREKEKNK